MDIGCRETRRARQLQRAGCGRVQGMLTRTRPVSAAMLTPRTWSLAGAIPSLCSSILSECSAHEWPNGLTRAALRRYAQGHPTNCGRSVDNSPPHTRLIHTFTYTLLEALEQKFQGLDSGDSPNDCYHAAPQIASRVYERIAIQESDSGRIPRSATNAINGHPKKVTKAKMVCLVTNIRGHRKQTFRTFHETRVVIHITALALLSNPLGFGFTSFARGKQSLPYSASEEFKI